MAGKTQGSSLHMLDHEPEMSGSSYLGRMPDSTNIGPTGHGIVGPVSVRVSDESLLIIGRYGGDQGARMRPAMLGGLVVGVAVGYLLTRTAYTSESFWIALGGVVVWSVCLFSGMLVPMVAVKRQVLRTARFAELSIPLRSIGFLGPDSLVDVQHGTVEAQLSQPLAGWLAARLSCRREVLLTAPTQTRRRQTLRIVLQDAAMADGLRAELRRRTSSTS